VNSGDFRVDAGTKGGFPAMNSPNNGERARSLLCGREALAKPPGAAGILSKGVGFNEEWDRGPMRVSGGA
jgi:hypothetical protein